jgi:hypothetical protein
LAIRLAYLVVGDGARELSQWLMTQLKCSLESEILLKRNQFAASSMAISWCVAMIGLFASGPVFAAGFAGFMVAGPSTGIGMHIVDNSAVKEFRQNLDNLESRLPSLHQLHHPLREFYTYGIAYTARSKFGRP